MNRRRSVRCAPLFGLVVGNRVFFTESLFMNRSLLTSFDLRYSANASARRFDNLTLYCGSPTLLGIAIDLAGHEVRLRIHQQRPHLIEVFIRRRLRHLLMRLN